MDLSRERTSRRLDMTLQKALKDIDTKVKIFQKKHSFDQRLIKKDLRYIINSGRKMALGDLNEWDSKRTFQRKHERFENIVNAMIPVPKVKLPVLAVTGESNNKDISRCSDTVQLPQLNVEIRSTVKRRSLVQSPTRPKPNSKWRMLSTVIRNNHKSSDEVADDESQGQSVSPCMRHSDHNPTTETIAEEIDSTDSTHLTSNRKTDQNADELMRRGSMAYTNNCDTSSRRPSIRSRRGSFALPTSRRTSVSEWTTVTTPSEESVGQTRRSSVNGNSSHKRPRAESDTIASRWRRLSVTTSDSISTQKSCSWRTSLASDQVVRTFIYLLLDRLKGSNQNNGDLSYLKECRYLRHYSMCDR